MYGAPLIGFHGHKDMPKRKRGRPSNLSKFLDRQGDLFLAEKYLAFVAGAFAAAPGTARPERGTREDGRPEAALGKPIRDLSPTGEAVGE